MRKCGFPAFFEAPWFGRWCFGIAPQGIGTIGMLLNFLVTIVVSGIDYVWSWSRRARDGNANTADTTDSEVS